MSHRNAVTWTLLLTLLMVAPADAVGLAGKGIKVGVALSDIGGPIGDLLGAQTRVAFSGGAFVSIRLGGVFQLQPELLFAGKGATDHLAVINISGEPAGKAKQTFTLDYLEIPVLTRVALPMQGPIRPSLLVGPALAIKLRSRASVDAPGYPDIDLNFVTGTDLGLVMGTSVDLHRGPRGFLIDARYTLGLTNVWGSVSPLNARNRTFALMAGYEF
jgi:hypothetical protein